MKTDDKKPDPLEALAAQADNLPPPLGEGVTDADVAERAAQEEAPALTNAQTLAGMFQLARDTVINLADVQSLNNTLPNPATEQLGAMWGKVLDGYGIQLSAYMGKHADLIAASIMTLVIAKGVRDGYMAERAAKAATPPPAPAPLPEVPSE